MVHLHSSPTLDDRQAAGKALRQTVPRSAQRDWSAPSDRADPVELVLQSNHKRIPDLIPIRHWRMMQSPFAFLRGSANIMAADLATLPITDLQVQACGDCHVANFGGFATPERNLIFDVNDFDETVTAPWEWDLKRLTTSLILAGRDSKLDDRDCSEVALAAAHAYRLAMAHYAEMSRLEVWYTRLDADLLVTHAPDEIIRKTWLQMTTKAFSQTQERIFLQMTEEVNGQRRFIDNPPLFYHPPDQAEYFEKMQIRFQQYRETLQFDRQFLLNHYHLVDVALKVVGVGSVGTHCGVALLLDDNHEPLLLQYKEARASVLEAYTVKSPYAYHGQRIVSGQRLMQAASDIFLGWTTNSKGEEYYFRQLKDMKSSIKLKNMSARSLEDYGEICGIALARAHARTGDPAQISGYLGRSDIFDHAITDFAITYAHQVEQDHQRFVEAIQAGRLEAREG
jgi:uncharacterized protein (DUF2252 family)